MYFCEAGWPVSWINKAQDLVTSEFKNKYKGKAPEVIEIDKVEGSSGENHTAKVCLAIF